MKPAILLFAVLSMPVAAFSATTWYVDDDNTSGPWHGTQHYPFQYITDGINAAWHGDTVLVGPGTYHENVCFRPSPFG